MQPITEPITLGNGDQILFSTDTDAGGYMKLQIIDIQAGALPAKKITKMEFSKLLRSAEAVSMVANVG